LLGCGLDGVDGQISASVLTAWIDDSRIDFLTIAHKIYNLWHDDNTPIVRIHFQARRSGQNTYTVSKYIHCIQKLKPSENNSLYGMHQNNYVLCSYYS